LHPIVACTRTSQPIEIATLATFSRKIVTTLHATCPAISSGQYRLNLCDALIFNYGKPPRHPIEYRRRK
jgi:hypothetical protein